MVVLMPNLDGTPLERLTDRVLERLVERHGAVVHPRLVEEGWVDLEGLQGRGWVEVAEVHPLPGEKVLVPTSTGWRWLEVL